MAIEPGKSALQSVLEEADAMHQTLRDAEEAANNNGGRKVVAPTLKVDDNEYLVAETGGTIMLIQK